MRSGRHVDVILLSNNDRLRPKLDSFMKDRRAHFRRTWGEGAAVIASICALMIALFLALEAFA
jgi:hypothetical protein